MQLIPAAPSRYQPWPEHGSLPASECYYRTSAHWGEIIAQGGTFPSYWSIIRCIPCVMIHVMPLPSEKELAQYYAGQYWQNNDEKIKTYEKDRQWWLSCVYEPLMSAIEIRMDYKENPTLLEVGPGHGFGLEAAWEHEWALYAVEPDAGWYQFLQTIDLLRDLWLWQGTLAAKKTDIKEACPTGFDAIMAYEVLEHQNNPEAFLLDCYELLASDGLLVIEVPNDFNPLQLAMLEKHGLAPWWIAPPDHLHYFTPKTLQLLLRRCGFVLEDMRGTYPMERFLDTLNYIARPELGRIAHIWRMQHELDYLEQGNWDRLDSEYRTNLAEQSIGREIVAIARKPK